MYRWNRLSLQADWCRQVPLDSQRVHQNVQGVAGDGSPLRGEKGFVYEGGHRIPFIVRWDNGIPANRVVRDQIIGLHDVFATIAAIAGAKVDSDQAHDSYDFSKVWQDPAAKHPLVRNSLFIQSNRPWEQNNKKSNNTWAAYQATQSANSLDLWKGVLETNVRKPDGKARANGVELFHLTKDPSESNNLIDASRLKAIERQFRTQSNQFRTAP